MNKAKETIVLEYEHRTGKFVVSQVKNTLRFLPKERLERAVVERLVSEAKSARVRPIEVVIKGSD